MTSVPPGDWLAAVRSSRDAGYRYFDWLGCVDEIGRSDTFRVVLVLRNLDSVAAGPRTLSTEVARGEPRLDSISSVFAGAGWHEREAAELFGVEFVGGSARRLLLDPGYSGTPLRKDEVLGSRAGSSWPGAKDPGESASGTAAGVGAGAPSRRRMVPPGVPDAAVWGDRDPDLPAADPSEVADATAGGRVRRRRG
jgi:NADH-quinone oxidoreductase subunit C